MRAAVCKCEIKPRRCLLAEELLTVSQIQMSQIRRFTDTLLPSQSRVLQKHQNVSKHRKSTKTKFPWDTAMNTPAAATSSQLNSYSITGGRRAVWLKECASWGCCGISVWAPVPCRRARWVCLMKRERGEGRSEWLLAPSQVPRQPSNLQGHLAVRCH